MTTDTILSECARRGIHLRADGELIKYSPIDAVGADLLAAMRARKAELLAELRQAALDEREYEYRVSQAIGGIGPPARDRECPSCGGGLQPPDESHALCSSCRWCAAHLAPARVQ